MRGLIPILCCLALPLAAQTRLELAPQPPERAEPRTDEVDVELILMVDVSRSMAPRELEIQRRGYAEALRSPEVVRAIESGMLGRIALSYVEWAGTGSQRVIVDWTVVDGAEAARAVSDRLTARFDPGLRRTSISGAIAYASDSIDGNGFEAVRRVIDVSGDGPNNQGAGVAGARDRAVARGLVINGLPLMTREGLGSAWHLDELDLYYADCVIGGPGAFAIPVLDWAEFAGAVRRKLVLELAGRVPERARAVPVDARPPFDCFVGEKLWETMRRDWMFP